MWFDIVKLDLSQVSTQIQGDAEGKNINIEESSKCQEKIRRFSDNLYSEFSLDDWANDHIENINENQGVPEKVFCWIVESIDKFFNMPFEIDRAFDSERSALKDRYSKRLRDTFTDDGVHFGINIFSSRHSNGGRPIYIRIVGPKEIAPYDDGERKMYFLHGLSQKDTIDKYERIKSCWERA